MKILYFAPCFLNFPEADAMVRELLGDGTHAAVAMSHGLDLLRIACANGGENWCWVDQAPLRLVRHLYNVSVDRLPPEGATPDLPLDHYELHVLVIPDPHEAPWEVRVLLYGYDGVLEAAGFE